ncbi:MAG: hypothetical protein IAA85_05695 [Firmicutes bacterium]|nr:hypothetical protein [Candidatus Alectryobacillus merdavium]
MSKPKKTITKTNCLKIADKTKDNSLGLSFHNIFSSSSKTDSMLCFE